MIVTSAKDHMRALLENNAELRSSNDGTYLGYFMKETGKEIRYHVPKEVDRKCRVGETHEPINTFYED